MVTVVPCVTVTVANAPQADASSPGPPKIADDPKSGTVELDRAGLSSPPVPFAEDVDTSSPNEAM